MEHWWQWPLEICAFILIVVVLIPIITIAILIDLFRDTQDDSWAGYGA